MGLSAPAGCPTLTCPWLQPRLPRRRPCGSACETPPPQQSRSDRRRQSLRSHLPVDLMCVRSLHVRALDCMKYALWAKLLGTLCMCRDMQVELTPLHAIDPKGCRRRSRRIVCDRHEERPASSPSRSLTVAPTIHRLPDFNVACMTASNRQSIDQVVVKRSIEWRRHNRGLHAGRLTRQEILRHF